MTHAEQKRDTYVSSGESKPSTTAAGCDFRKLSLLGSHSLVTASTFQYASTTFCFNKNPFIGLPDSETKPCAPLGSSWGTELDRLARDETSDAWHSPMAAQYPHCALRSSQGLGESSVGIDTFGRPRWVIPPLRTVLLIYFGFTSP